MIHIDSFFRHITDELLANSTEPQFISDDELLRPANRKNQVLVEQIIEKLLLPGSEVVGFEHLSDLYRRSQAGESCILLMEHYSNFDIPNLFFLAKENPLGTEFLETIVAMAGMKLNEESKFVLAFTEAYTRLVIYPPRALVSLEGKPEYEQEQRRSRQVNRKALHQMIRLKHEGHIILLFPAGTRYHPAKPNSKQMLTQVESYLRGFDHMVMVGIAGNTLEVNPSGLMNQDLPKQDVVIYQASPVLNCDEFRARALEGSEADGEDAKRIVADAVGTELDLLHRDAEEIRKQRLEQLESQGFKPIQVELPDGT